MPRLLQLELVLVLLAGSLSTTWAAAPADETSVRRVMALLSVVVEEYREGVQEGAVVQPIEYEEALVFLDEASGRTREALPDEQAIAADFVALRSALDEKRPLPEIERLAEGLRERIAAVTGITQETLPPGPASSERGRVLFEENCTSCHGESADGKGSNATDLDPPPADFTDPGFMRAETPYDFFHILTVGKARSAMPAWGEALSVQDRWDLVSYLWSVRGGAARLAEGHGAYLAHCAGCHGATGDGTRALGSELPQPPPNLREIGSLARNTDAELADIIAEGVPGTAMPAFGRVLDDGQIWALIGFLRHLSFGNLAAHPAAAELRDAEPARFGGLLRVLAREYERAQAGQADGAAVELLVAQVEQRADPMLRRLLEESPGEALPIQRDLQELLEGVRGRRDTREVVSAAGTLANRMEALGAAPILPAAQPDGRTAFAEVRQLLEEAVQAHQRGDARAVYLVSDAYFAFEPLEKPLGITAPQIVARVEERFLALRGLIGSSGPPAEVSRLAGAIMEELEKAESALAPAPNRYVVMVQSATIILREGFEVLLLLTALLAYAVKSGHPQMRRPIFAGAASGIAASLLTAWALTQLVRGASGQAAEALEGITMLLASAVLFWVSYWLVSKAEAEKWQSFIQGKVKSAVARGSGVALAATAFLAVYREGVETVLFYRALIGSSASTLSPVVAGFCAGALLLALAGTAFVRFGMRMPIRPFFLGTSALLYALAFVFAGRGVAELQEAGWISITPAPGVPQIAALGIHPTVESLLAQSIFLLLLLYALLATWRSRRRAPSEEDRLLAEVQHLRQLLLALHAELGALIERDPPRVRRAREHLGRLIDGVTDLKERVATRSRRKRAIG